MWEKGDEAGQADERRRARRQRVGWPPWLPKMATETGAGPVSVKSGARVYLFLVLIINTYYYYKSSLRTKPLLLRGPDDYLLCEKKPKMDCDLL